MVKMGFKSNLSILSALIFAFLVLFSAAAAHRALAVAPSDWHAGRIIDDSIFYNSNTLSSGDIQNFLNSKVPVCDTNGTQIKSGSQTRAQYSQANGVNPPFTCLKDAHANIPSLAADSYCSAVSPVSNASSAQIISTVSQACGLNPEVILVLLQKEEGLITDDWPWPVQYQQATGFACPDSSSCDPKYADFFSQVYFGARQYQIYAKQPTWFNFIAGKTSNVQYNPNTSCGSSPVTIQDRATAGLYNYTPYQPNQAALNNMYIGNTTGDSCSAYGNRNFWKMFNEWFGPTIVGSAASPLYKATGSPEIYVVSEGSKYLVPSPDILIDYGLTRYDAATVDQSFLDGFPAGSTLTNLAKKQFDSSGTIFMFDDGRRFRIQSGQQCTDWGLDCFNTNVTKTLPNSFIDLYTNEVGTIPPMMAYNGVVYRLEGGKKRPIISPIFVDVLGGWGQVQPMKDSNASQPLGKALIADKTIVKYGSNPNLYMHEAGTLYPIDSIDAISAWGLTNFVNPPSIFDTDPLPRGSSLSIFASDSGGNKYLVSAGVKYSLQGQESYWSGFTFQSFTTPTGQLSSLSTVNPYSAFRSTVGEIFIVYNSKRYIFPTMDDFLGLGYDTARISPASNLLSIQATYGGLNLSNGRMFKISGSDQIYRINGGNSQYVNSTNYPGLPYAKIITIDSITAARYPVSGTYTP